MSGALVLLVEDDPDHADLIGGALEDAGHRVAHAPGGDAARRALAEETPDLALLDYSLGSETGFDVLAVLREALPELPVVLLTGHGSEDLVVEALQRGATDFLVKSLDRGFLRVLPLYVSKNLERARLAAALRRAEAESARQEAWRRLVVDSLDAVVLTVDGHFAVIDANRAFSRLADSLGIPAGSPIGRRCPELLGHGPLLQTLQEGRTALALAEEELLRREVVVEGAGGRRELQVEATPLQAVDRGEGVVFVITDVTEPSRARREEEALTERLGRANEELQRLADVRERLVEAVSRQLRSPALTVGGYAKMLASGSLGKLPRKAVQALDVVARSARRLSGLADDLDYLARGPQAAPPPDETVPLAPLLEQALEAGASGRKERRLRVRRELPDPVPPLAGDGPRLQGLLETLLADAAADCRERASLFVRVAAAEDGVRIRVEDDGSGPAGEAVSPRTDLAMEVAREVVRRHGGTLERLSREGGGRGGWLLVLPGGEPVATPPAPPGPP